MSPAYAELHCLSNFSFQRGASSALELFERAKRLGYCALAITDECSFSGIVRALEASEKTGLKLIVGAEFLLAEFMPGKEATKFLLLARNVRGYQAISALITRARRAAAKGEYQLISSDISAIFGTDLPALEGVIAIALAADFIALGALKSVFPTLRLGVCLTRSGDQGAQLARALFLAQRTGVLPLACTGALMHARNRRPLHDVLTATRLNCSVAQAGYALQANAEKHLRTRAELQEIYPPELLAEAVAVAESCSFSLRQLQYHYPCELVPPGLNATLWLRKLTETGMQRRWPDGVAASVRAQIEHELKLIAELGYEAFFLTVEDIVRFARSQHILCQGRGSAANSAVCFALGITEIDPARMSMLFERFISKERNEAPDIDVDFEHERREEVFQYIYQKYGRERAALAATVICYRPKSAIRDVGKALGLGADQLSELSAALSWWRGAVDDAPPEAPAEPTAPGMQQPTQAKSTRAGLHERLRERGFDPNSRVLVKLLTLSQQLLGFPRHLSQHVGGFVISDAPLSSLVPVENAAMADRTILQWDKDDLDTLGLLKVDCLALGMLSCLRGCMDLIAQHAPELPKLSLASIPAQDSATFEMICRADTLGVFQIESRAQMSMLPRLQPRTYYDLVIETAIVRPGPIQGGMVHPYLRRRQGLEPVVYPSEELKKVFERTLGVPIFQEQVMQLAIVAAGYTPGEADGLRRSMAAWKRRGGLEHHRQRILTGMAERGYPQEFAEQVFEQIKGFGAYGFPESHAASFALLVYASCWLKCHHPAAFACALLNAQPMGFYQPAQIIADVQRHGVSVLPVDVCESQWFSSLCQTEAAHPLSLRLGLHQIRGLSALTGARVVAARTAAAFRDSHDLAQRAGLDAGELKALANSDALRQLSCNRHQARWAIAAIQAPLPFAEIAQPRELAVTLPPPSEAQDVLADYASIGLSLRAHPIALIRGQLRAQKRRTHVEVNALRNGTSARAAGLVTLRQRPGTASGVTFVTLEDETGVLNVVIWRDLFERQRRVLLESQVLGVDGVLESASGVTHLIAKKLISLDHMLGELNLRARNFH